MMNARKLIDDLCESEAAPVAPPKPKQPLAKPGQTPGRKFQPFRRRDIKPGTAPRPKADFASTYSMEEAKKKAKGQVAASPGKITYGKKVKESAARRYIEAEDLAEARKKKAAKGQVAASPGKISYGKRHESLLSQSLAARLLRA